MAGRESVELVKAVGTVTMNTASLILTLMMRMTIVARQIGAMTPRLRDLQEIETIKGPTMLLHLLHLRLHPDVVPAAIGILPKNKKKAKSLRNVSRSSANWNELITSGRLGCTAFRTQGFPAAKGSVKLYVSNAMSNLIYRLIFRNL